MNKQGSQNVATCKPVTTFNNNAAAIPEATAKKRRTSKIHERRQFMRPKLEIVKPLLSFKPTGTTPSSKSGITNFLTSPLCTPSSLFFDLSLIEGDKAEPASFTTNIDPEEKAIKERRFYLYPSPRYTEPELLTLFPLTSPNSSSRPKIRQNNLSLPTIPKLMYM
ncbi:hypothetical protein N665_3277s0002 [Sinapis alba]|nr:hypothetical protein N665_3277s0002 [Sinapis alba]